MVSDVNNDQYLRVWELDKLLAGDLKPLSEFPLRAVRSESFVFTRTDAICTGAATTPAYPTSSATRLPHWRGRGCLQRGNGFLPSGAARGRAAAGAGRARATVSFGNSSSRVRSRTSVRSRSWAPSSLRNTPWSRPGRCRRRVRSSTRRKSSARARTFVLKNVGLDNTMQGYKDYGGIGCHFNFGDPLAYAEFGVTAAAPTAAASPGMRGATWS